MGRRRKGVVVNGWLVLDKPAGLTSTDALNRCRRLLNAQKAGHAGTLDPLATGILPIAFGEATKCVALVTDGEKTYRFTARFGAETDTCDTEGEITARSDRRPTPAEIESVLAEFTGPVMQAPPAYSAIKVNGRRAYDLAREGTPPDLPERLVHIHELTLLGMPETDLAEFEMTCGKGTYVRSLARDIGRALGAHAHVNTLRRTRVAGLDETGAISLADFESLCDKAAGNEAILSVETALDDIPAVAITGEQASRMRHGQAVRVLNLPTEDEDALILVKAAQQPVALARIDGDMIQPVRIFNL